uniref:Leucine zipper transcription factor-like protein 1 n=1 Tax=Phallusia mammillata TaxID=59560 RepID=A0A6F9DK56_9ASCI|nr:leucine zipper transcription factor-like protein 1 [Phallusia mammillata]
MAVLVPGGRSKKSELGVNDHHHQHVVNFIRFCRFKRVQRLKAVDHCFQDLKDSRLYEDTYTQDEVTEMLDGLLSMVRGEMEVELLNGSHTSVLLLRQLMTQAEKWHLKLAADISELENRELLDQIADFEERELSLGGASDPLSWKQKLEPLNEQGGVALLQMEIERLQKENGELRERSQSIEKHVTKCLEDNQILQQQIKSLGAKPAVVTDKASTNELEGQLSQLREEFDSNLQVKSTENENLLSSLTSTKHELLKVQEQLDLAEKELDKKFRETAAYKNLRDMLAKKNEQLKELRKRIGKYETTD